MMYGYGDGWAFWLMFLVTIVLVAAIVVAVVFALRGWTVGDQTGQGSPRSTPDGASPKDILKRRYAVGEIDREEFLQRLSDLDS
jgi:putative membrane protein